MSKRTRWKRWRGLIAVVAVVLIAGSWALDASLRPLVQEYAVNRAKTLAGEAMTCAVDTVLQRVDGYGDLTEVQRDDAGAVLSVRANTSAINRLSADVVATLGTTLAKDDFSRMTIPLFNATGHVFLAGRGPKVVVEIQQNGAATALINGSFSGAGINQTVHRLELTLSFRMVVLIAGMSEPIETVGTFLISETVIVGTVPELFANITRS